MMTKNTMSRKVPLMLTTYTSVDRELTPRSLELEFGIVSVVDGAQDVDPVMSTIAFATTHAKILALCEAVVNESIMLSVEDFHAERDIFEQFNNNFITMPGLFDSNLAAAFFLKFWSIAEDSVEIEYVKITDLVSGTTYCHQDEHEVPNADVLPDVSYIGEFPIWESPWWLRDDVTLSDDTADDPTQLQEVRSMLKQNLVTTRELWDSIEASVKEIYLPESEEPVEVETTSGEVVKVNFGKKDDTVH